MFCSEIFLGEFQMDVKTIAVIGAGTMGRGIAYAAAFGGYRAILEDITQSMLDAGLDYIRTSLDEGVTRGKLPAEQRDRGIAQLRSEERRVVREGRCRG